jgi:hypothetical protein
MAEIARYAQGDSSSVWKNPAGQTVSYGELAGYPSAP